MFTCRGAFVLSHQGFKRTTNNTLSHPLIKMYIFSATQNNCSPTEAFLLHTRTHTWPVGVKNKILFYNSFNQDTNLGQTAFAKSHERNVVFFFCFWCLLFPPETEQFIFVFFWPKRLFLARLLINMFLR